MRTGRVAVFGRRAAGATAAGLISLTMAKASRAAQGDQVAGVPVVSPPAPHSIALQAAVGFLDAVDQPGSPLVDHAATRNAGSTTLSAHGCERLDHALAALLSEATEFPPSEVVLNAMSESGADRPSEDWPTAIRPVLFMRHVCGPRSIIFDLSAVPNFGVLSERYAYALIN